MSGIHHVTAISGRACRNLDFYAGTLGMRFVKKTVNFDDPGTNTFITATRSDIRGRSSRSSHGSMLRPAGQASD